MMYFWGSGYYRGSGFRIFPSHIRAALNSSQLSEIIFFSSAWLQFDTSLVKTPVPKMAKNTAIYERFREKGSRHCYQSRRSGNGIATLLNGGVWKSWHPGSPLPVPLKRPWLCSFGLKLLDSYKSLLPLLNYERIWWKKEGWVKYSRIWWKLRQNNLLSNSPFPFWQCQESIFPNSIWMSYLSKKSTVLWWYIINIISKNSIWYSLVDWQLFYLGINIGYWN